MSCWSNPRVLHALWHWSNTSITLSLPDFLYKYDSFQFSIYDTYQQYFYVHRSPVESNYPFRISFISMIVCNLASHMIFPIRTILSNSANQLIQAPKRSLLALTIAVINNWYFHCAADYVLLKQSGHSPLAFVIDQTHHQTGYSAEKLVNWKR